MSNTRHRCRRRRTETSYSLARLLLLFLLICIQQRPIRAGFGRRDQREADQEAETETVDHEKEAAAAGQDNGAAEETVPETEAATESIPEKTEREPTTTEPEATSDAPPPPAPPRPPSILEAEARTARELSRAVATLTRDLDACRDRADAIEEGFQGLYAAHLANVDGLRRCREGVLSADELRAFPAADVAQPAGVDPALLARAGAREDARERAQRDEEVAARHRELLLSLEDRVAALVRRERS